jgi:hypothetical protein
MILPSRGELHGVGHTIVNMVNNIHSQQIYCRKSPRYFYILNNDFSTKFDMHGPHNFRFVKLSICQKLFVFHKAISHKWSVYSSLT